MGVLRTLRGLTGERRVTLHECRQCGESLPEDAVRCPTCGSEEIAHYEW